MTALQPQYQTLLERTLIENFVPHLPPLLDKTRPSDEQYRKNLSRAFSAFALHRICEISQVDAAKAVVDDFDDNGIDAIYYMAGNVINLSISRSYADLYSVIPAEAGIQSS